MKRIIKNILGKSRSKEKYDQFFISPNAKFQKSSTSVIENSTIRLENDSQLIVGENILIKDYNIHVIKGKCIINSETKLIGAINIKHSNLYIEDGIVNIGDHCIIKADFSVRFGGKCSIGSFTGIMDNTEIRCDEEINIGSYNMISYECMIYDTNTHCQYGIEERREMTRKSFPHIGAEKEKPKTASVNIGDDCWIGKRSAVLKGVTVGCNSTIAACAVLTKSCKENSIVYGNPAISKLK
jgi:acetyltransferase-like isoleucine patch superfamily enzyme